MIFFYDEGAEMSAVYHSIISTLKLSGKSVWNFFGDFFRSEVLGLDTYKEYLPALTRKKSENNKGKRHSTSAYCWTP